MNILNFAVKIVTRLFIGRKAPKYQNKGGWPGLSILPKVKNLIDIGIGHQGTFGLYKFFPDSRYIFIDPLEETKLSVQSLLELGKEHNFVCTALGATSGTTSLNVRHPISQSGVYRYEDEDLSKVEVRTVPVKSLDMVLKESNLKGSLGIKIDVEGYEMEVLKGASKALELAQFVILELPIGRPRFSGSYSFEDAIIFMKKRNFCVSSIRASGDGTDHCDVAFLKLNSNQND